MEGLVLCDKASRGTSPRCGRWGHTAPRTSSGPPRAHGWPLKLVEWIFRGDGAPEWFAATQRAADACIGESWTEGGLPNRLELMTAPDLGDDAVAYLINTIEPATATGAELTRRGPLIAVLAGDELLWLHAIDLQKTGSEPRLDDAELIEIATTAVDKIEAQR